MPATSKCRALAETLLAEFDGLSRSFADELRRQREGKLSESRLDNYRCTARHFLIWLSLARIELRAVDGSIIQRFLQHECRCGASCASVRVRRWNRRRTSAELMRFVRFLESAGHIETTGELEDNLRLLDAFLAGLGDEGYTASSVKSFRYACTGFIVWLHLSRIRLRDLTPDVFAQYRNKEFVCSIPGLYSSRRKRGTEACHGQLRGFLRHLVSIGRIAPPEPVPLEPALPARLERFALWLERHRGIAPRSIRQHVRAITQMLPALGDDPGTYDASLIRRALLEAMRPWSHSTAQHLATSVRMYLRFLVSEDSVPATLVAAVPSAAQRRLSGLPRHIPPEDVERAIASCGGNPAGLRDRAILLLLARLALRAGDVAALRLGDIDWDRAEIRVAGKSCRQAALPLPQDVGDALHAYIAEARPATDEDKVFLRAMAPARALAAPSTVSGVAKRALDRAGVTTLAGRGAHVFRHSQATGLLRSGADLDVIQALLRHASPGTTAIYAKTDTVMLQEVAQPWIGGSAR